MAHDMYENFLSAGFAELNAEHYRHMVEMYRYNYEGYLPADKTAKILDIGCGMGQFLTFVGELGYDNYFGVDLSAEAIAFCRDKGIGKVQKIDDLKIFLNTADQYDLICLNDVIEHFPKSDIVPLLKVMYQKLNHGGRILIKTGNLASMVGPRIRYNDFTHEVGFTEYSLRQVLINAGFHRAHIDLVPFSFSKNSPLRMVRYVGQRIVHALWKLTYFLEYTAPPKIVDELIVAVAKK